MQVDCTEGAECLRGIIIDPGLMKIPYHRGYENPTPPGDGWKISPMTGWIKNNNPSRGCIENIPYGGGWKITPPGDG